MAYENTFLLDLAKELTLKNDAKSEESFEVKLTEKLQQIKVRATILETSRRKMARAFSEVLSALKIAYPELNLEDENFNGTADRVARAYLELCAGLGIQDKEVFSKSFPVSGNPELITLKDIEYSSLCNHHFFPFLGKAHVGYLPGEVLEGDAKVTGLSKLARIVEVHARRPQLQERMGQDIVNAINNNLNPKGAIVVIEGMHSCLGCRGARKPQAQMITIATAGVFKQDHNLRKEFLGIINLNKN
jgi:GTP cyclohydrolase I